MSARFADENLTLLSHELISAAERRMWVSLRTDWSASALAMMRRPVGPLYVVLMWGGGEFVGHHVIEKWQLCLFADIADTLPE